jgi:hypothetical protein
VQGAAGSPDQEQHALQGGVQVIDVAIAIRIATSPWMPAMIAAAVRSGSSVVPISGEVFALIQVGKLHRHRPTVGAGETPRAHADIESRRTTGKLLLIP